MILFIHGGPGLNSEAERRFLGPKLEQSGSKVRFWNEPSALRGDTDGGAHPFDHINASLQSAADQAWSDNQELPIDLVAHSFGAQYALRYIQRSPERVRSLYLIAPCLDLDFCFRNILEHSAEDFKKLGNAEAVAGIESALADSRAFHDAAMQAGLATAFTNPSLLTHYWVRQDAIGHWASVIQEPSFILDVPGMARILSDYAPTWREILAFDVKGVPVRAIFGAHDHVVEATHETRTLLGIAPDAECETWTDVAHFIHFECAERMVDDILRFRSNLDLGAVRGIRGAQAQAETTMANWT